MDWVIPVLLGFSLGFVIGLTGVGGGALVAPALYVILGLTYRDSVALSLVYSLFTKIVGGVQHARQGTVLWRVTLLYGLAGVPGAIVGSHAIYRVGPTTQHALPFLMGAILIVVSTLILMERPIREFAVRYRRLSPSRIPPTAAVGVAAFQLVVGVLIGVTSVGSGSLVILSMLYLFRMSARQIVGSNIVISLMMIIPAGLAHYAIGNVDLPLLALLLTGSLAGTVLGSKATTIVSEGALKQTMVVLIALGAIAAMLKAWTGGDS